MIVGAERGLGLGLANQFFRRGWGVLGTARRKTDSVEALRRVGNEQPDRLEIEYIDVTDGQAILPFEKALGDRSFDVIFMNAGIYGPLHQSILEATASEIMESFMTNTIGPIYDEADSKQAKLDALRRKSSQSVRATIQQVRLQERTF